MPRANQLEVTQRARVVRQCLAKGMLKCEIKEALRKKWPTLHARTIENYISKAVVELAKELDQSKDDALAESLAFYRSMLTDDKVSDALKVRVRRQMDRLLGLLHQPAEANAQLHQHQHLHAGEQAVNIYLPDNGRQVDLIEQQAN